MISICIAQSTAFLIILSELKFKLDILVLTVIFVRFIHRLTILYNILYILYIIYVNINIYNNILYILSIVSLWFYLPVLTQVAVVKHN